MLNYKFRISKAVFLLLATVIIRIATGCCKTEEILYYFDFNKVILFNIDNTGPYPRELSGESMNAEAVAFRLDIFDSASEINYGTVLKSTFSVFNTATAFQCEPVINFQARAYLKQICITTLYPMSDELPAGSEVSRFFVGSSLQNQSPLNSLYSELTTICRQTEGKLYHYIGNESFYIFLKPAVEYDTARFAIDLTFSDDRIVRDTTAMININR